MKSRASGPFTTYAASSHERHSSGRRLRQSGRSCSFTSPRAPFWHSVRAFLTALTRTPIASPAAPFLSSLDRPRFAASSASSDSAAMGLATAGCAAARLRRISPSSSSSFARAFPGRIGAITAPRPATISPTVS